MQPVHAYYTKTDTVSWPHLAYTFSHDILCIEFLVPAKNTLLPQIKAELGVPVRADISKLLLITPLEWSSKNRQCEVLPFTNDARQDHSERPAANPQKYTSAFKAEYVRQVAAGARQTDVACAQGLSPALLGRWQRQALVEAVPSSVERDEIKRLCAELKRVEQARDILKEVKPSLRSRLCHEPLPVY